MTASTHTTQPCHGYPLYVHIGTLFTLVILGVGIAIAWFNYAQSSRLALRAADENFTRINEELVADLAQGHRLTRATVELLALSPVAIARTREERMRMLPMFHEALRANDRLASLYVGYEDGDFFQMRPLRSAAERALFAAPERAEYLLWSVEPSAAGEPDSRYLFLDGALAPLAERAADTARFDPRQRPWYASARDSDRMAVVPPYVFFTTREVGTTMSRRSPGGGSVVAADLTLARLSEILAAHVITPSAELALYTEEGHVLAYRDPARVVQEATLATLDTLGVPVLARLASGMPGSAIGELEHEGRVWKTLHRSLPVTEEVSIRLAIAAPLDELVAEAVAVRNRALGITVLILLAALPIAWLVSRLLSRPLGLLAGEAQAISEFDFARPITTRSVVVEIDRLARTMDDMKRTVRRFLGISTDLTAEHRFAALLQQVGLESMTAMEADGAVVYLVNEDRSALEPAAIELGEDVPEPPAEELPVVPLLAGEDRLREAALRGETTVYQIPGETPAHQQRAAEGLLAALGWPHARITAIPLTNPQHELVGVLALLHRTDRPLPEDRTASARLAFARALAGVAAAAIDNQRLYKAHKDLLAAFIKLIAGAIDAKSPYTGGHCQRVPALTQMLARAACESDAPPFRNFCLGDEQWEELGTASWLHDCGKVTTPEYVVDKATKLETKYDRIHEIRTRFEVLKRDAEIACWKAIAAGGDAAALRAGLEEERKSLDEEFAFVARCNPGGESMAPEDVGRLARIGSRRWLRTLDDRLGVSWEELQRMQRVPAAALPVSEPLLADRPEHIVERPPGERLDRDNPWGFRMDVPPHKYNRGELYNLSVARGTLTAEERYAINDHIVQTIIMLEGLPFPRNLRHVPEIAGGHHEKMDGTGYPRGLTGEQMSLPARMMAIADIFEALTAADRPYKTPKTLSEAVAIMCRMCRERHIDRDLFALFLTAGVYREYAERYLAPEQIDEVDVAACLAAA